MLKLILIRIIIPAMIGTIGYNILNDFPPLSWIDADKRKIVKLEKQLVFCEESKDQLIIDINKLQNSVSKQNSAISNLSKNAEEKQAEANARAKRLNKQLRNLKDKLNTEDPRIESCQDAIDYLIGDNDE